MDPVLQGSEAKGERRDCHGGGVPSPLLWAAVGINRAVRNSSSRAEAQRRLVVNRRLFSPSPWGRVTPGVTSVVEWRNKTWFLWREGSGKRRDDNKTGSKFCLFLESHSNSERFTGFTQSKNSHPEITGKDAATHFPLP